MIGMCTTYVGDTFHAGTDSYSLFNKETEESFNWKKRESDNIEFSGLQIESKGEAYDIHLIYICLKAKAFKLAKYLFVL